MAKYRRRRYYRRRKGRWSSNIKEFSQTGAVPANSTGFFSFDLCLNPVQTDSAVSQIYTFKNVDISGWFETDTSNAANVLENATYYIMFLPQGLTVTSNYNLEHPEYILALYYQVLEVLDISLP